MTYEKPILSTGGHCRVKQLSEVIQAGGAVLVLQHNASGYKSVPLRRLSIAFSLMPKSREKPAYHWPSEPARTWFCYFKTNRSSVIKTIKGCAGFAWDNTE